MESTGDPQAENETQIQAYPATGEKMKTATESEAECSKTDQTTSRTDKSSGQEVNKTSFIFQFKRAMLPFLVVSGRI